MYARAAALVSLPFLVLVAMPRGVAADDASCADGRYQVEGRPLLAAGGEAVVLGGDTVAIEGVCRPVKGHVRARPGGGHWVFARWRSCLGARHVQLRGLVSPDCSVLDGGVRALRPKHRRAFHATRCDDPATCRPSCESDADCDAAQWCAKRAGDCDGVGLCIERRRDLGCILVLDPVCGCDGKTYGNECEAFVAQANVRHRGACEQACDVSTPCGDGELCELPNGICASDLDAGVCVDVPEVCPLYLDPVCGCDGETYGNDCERRMAKVQKARNGACEVECGSPCDCYANPELRLADDCPMLCPMCGNYWSCEAGECVDRCGFIPPIYCERPPLDPIDPIDPITPRWRR
jgi:hypothetical protein